MVDLFVDFVDDGLQMVEKFEQIITTPNDRYALILTDYNMPIMTGFEATKKIRDICDLKNIEHPYVAVISGFSDREFVDRGFENRVDEVISKPSTIDNMEKILRDIVKFE